MRLFGDTVWFDLAVTALSDSVDATTSVHLSMSLALLTVDESLFSRFDGDSSQPLQSLFTRCI